MVNRTFRYEQFTIAQDPSAWPEYSAMCVSGEDVECGVESGGEGNPEAVEEWMRQHTQGTGHRRYRRNISDYAVWELAALDIRLPDKESQ
ncbi:hypothetical protein AB0I22_31335 [Streptomyces sp. NPDC050610]|uniref:DUF7848 domain-containing protein n=1 Tax=Streptomyces sp. NPDC050610 TaxID=3157097 RepID=UPI003416443E